VYINVFVCKLHSFTFSHTPIHSFTHTQVPEITQSHWVRYLKIKLISHYGNEYYCTLTNIQVYIYVYVYLYACMCM
jgi:hypothetical protein